MHKKKLLRLLKHLIEENNELWSFIATDPAILQKYFNKVHNDRLELIAHDILHNGFTTEKPK